jgi:hypothetical protein
VLSALAALCGLNPAGCGGGSGTTLSNNPQAGAVFVTGEDAPLPSVVSLNLTINSITLTGASNSLQQVSSPITVDFARLVGLRAPLAFNAVPADTYTKATFVLSSPVINYISAGTPPQVSTLNGTFTNPTSTNPQTTSVVVTFPTPMVVGASGLAGMHTEFDIRQSLAVDGSGQVTGVINPVMFIEAVKATNPEGQITDLTGTIVSVNVAGNSFLTQGPLGHQFTVDVDGNTNYNAGFTLATLPTSGVFVSLQGTVQMDGSILASDVEFVTTDLALTSGRILALNPTTGPECEPGPGGANRRQSSRPVAHRQLARLGHGFAECLLCQARASTHGRCGRSLIRRTAVCGPACTVVWQGRRGDPSPYADFEAL